MSLLVLHTADWHLGARLADRTRLDEHQHFLDWLLDEVRARGVHLLIVAGDVFDQANPPIVAREQYFRFLARLYRETDAQAVIVAGNHDSVGVIEAPGSILATLRVQVVGRPRSAEALSLPIRGSTGEVEAWVMAVPFLRGPDLPAATGGETVKERHERLVSGVRHWYAAALEAVDARAEPHQARIATGHLFAAGGALSDTERGFQVGHQSGVPADAFPEGLDYVALGHLHRPQDVPGAPCPMVYPGSPIPMSFAELVYDQGVELLRFDGRELVERERVPIPAFPAVPAPRRHPRRGAGPARGGAPRRGRLGGGQGRAGRPVARAA